MEQVDEITTTASEHGSYSAPTETFGEPFCHVCLAELPALEEDTEASVVIIDSLIICFCPTCHSPSHLHCHLQRQLLAGESPYVVIHPCSDCA